MQKSTSKEVLISGPPMGSDASDIFVKIATIGSLRVTSELFFGCEYASKISRFFELCVQVFRRGAALFSLASTLKQLPDESFALVAVLSIISTSIAKAAKPRLWFKLMK